MIAELETSLLAMLRGKCSSLTISFNDHACSGQDAATAMEWGEYANVNWASEEEKAAACAKNSVWVLQWFPNTPVGSYSVAASSLAACLEFGFSSASEIFAQVSPKLFADEGKPL